MSTYQVITGNELNFDSSILQAMPTGSEHFDHILSDDGGLMPATNMLLAGGAGSGKTTVTLDLLSGLQANGKKVLFVSGEMDEIGYFKYCQRMPNIVNIPVLYIKNYQNTIQETLEEVLNEGWDVVALDSVAEILGMHKISQKCTETVSERWYLSIQDKHKQGKNPAKKYTSFINIQQVDKSGNFIGSNRLKHMTDATFIIKVNKDSGTRLITFDKNRDCGNTETTVGFNIVRGSKIEYFYGDN